MATPLLHETELLYSALAADIGIVVRTSSFALAQQRLYRARREAADPELAKLQIRRSPIAPETEIWILKLGTVTQPQGSPQ